MPPSTAACRSDNVPTVRGVQSLVKADVTAGGLSRGETSEKLMAKAVEQEEKYWAEDAQLYEHDFDAISDGEE